MSGLISNPEVARNKALIRQPIMNLVIPHLPGKPGETPRQKLIEAVARMPDYRVVSLNANITTFNFAAPEYRGYAFQDLYHGHDATLAKCFRSAFPSRTDREAIIKDIVVGSTPVAPEQT